MPRVELRVPADTFTDEEQSQLTEQLTDALLRAEGASPDNEMAQEIAWVFIDEYDPESWTIGGNPTEDFAFEATVSATEPSLTQEVKERMVEAVTDVLMDFAGNEFDPMKSWVIINEVPDGNWGVGGEIYGYDDFVAYVSED